MPIHDWTRVDAGIFHAFHHDWITYISSALNRGLLPPRFYALPEVPPQVRYHIRSESIQYATRAKAVVGRGG
jgi:hypothetical protein